MRSEHNERMRTCHNCAAVNAVARVRGAREDAQQVRQEEPAVHAKRANVADQAEERQREPELTTLLNIVAASSTRVQHGGPGQMFRARATQPATNKTYCRVTQWM
jgi:hypothetical protein